MFAVDAGATSDAVSIFFEYGFVVLKGALKPEAVQEVLQTCRSLHQSARKEDADGLGNRGRGRYSFHHLVAPGQCLHFKAFTRHLVDNQSVLDVLDAVYAEANRRRQRRLESATARAEGSSEGGFAEASLSDARSAGENNFGLPAVSAAKPVIGTPYAITGAGGDFCEGWVREFQPLHSDYGRARPLKGPPWWSEGDFPVHDKDMPPMISANYVVQPLTRWNGATRLIPWAEMDRYVTEVSGSGAVSTDPEIKLPPPLATDPQTFRYYKKDPEVAPLLGQELHRRPRWLASRIFPLDAGDVIIRDVRVWHGGCPNLSREPRYLPSIEVASAELCANIGSRGYKQAWPPRRLPAVYAKAMSTRAQTLCAAITEQENDGFVSSGLEDFTWLKYKVGFPAKRNHFQPGVQLEQRQCAAISLRACLEQLKAAHGRRLQPSDVGNGFTCSDLLSAEQAAWLCSQLEQLSSHATKTEKSADNGKLPRLEHMVETASALLTVLAKGPLGSIFADGVSTTAAATEKCNVDDKAASLAHELLAYLRPGHDHSGKVQSDEVDRRVRRRIE